MLVEYQDELGEIGAVDKVKEKILETQAMKCM